MNHYDDLQRFKDKTRTQNMTFKDLSGQSSVAERGDWAIMNQLSPTTEEKSALGTGGSVAQAIPQPVSGETFMVPDMPAASDRAPEPVAPAAPPAMNTAPVPPAVPVAPSVPAAQAAPAAPRTENAPRPAASGAVNYSRLFSAQGGPAADSAGKREKDVPLKSLLERIASCR